MNQLARSLVVAAFANLAGLSAVHGAELVIGVPTEATSIDPHYQALAPNQQVRRHIFEALVAVAPDNALQPELATAWALTADSHVWEFRLRAGVRFHDGTPLTARDAAFSIMRAFDVPGAPSTLKRYIEDVAEAVAIDDLTLRVRTKVPAPLLPSALALIGVVPERLGRDVAPSAFNTGAAAIGSGPYRLREYRPGSHVSLAANAGHWGGAPPWDGVTFKLLSNNGARVAALLAGDVDVIAEVPTNDVARLRGDARLAVAQGPSHRVMMWAMDVAREHSPFITAKDGGPIGNPLRERRVREAFSLAIDRRALVERVMEGQAIATNQIVPPGYSGHDPALGVPEADLARARALMAEAGYAQGFRLTLHTTNNRYMNDARLAQAVAQMLARIGVEVSVNAMPVALYYGAARKLEFTMPQIGWGHPSGDAITVLREALRSRSTNNYGRWSSPAFDQALERAEREMDLVARHRLLQQASRIAAAEIALIPTHFQVNLWASRQDLRVTPRIDELTLANAVARR